MTGRADRDQQSNRTGDRAQSAMGGGDRTSGSSGRPGGVSNVGQTNRAAVERAFPSSPISSPGGGTYTSNTYSPGAVGNFPNANAAAVAGMLSSAVPGFGLANGVFNGVKSLQSPSSPPMGIIGNVFGGNPGPQHGWAPDRSHGVANGVGGAQGSGPAIPMVPQGMPPAPGGAPFGAQPQQNPMGAFFSPQQANHTLPQGYDSMFPNSLSPQDLALLYGKALA